MTTQATHFAPSVPEEVKDALEETVETILPILFDIFDNVVASASRPISSTSRDGFIPTQRGGYRVTLEIPSHTHPVSSNAGQESMLECDVYRVYFETWVEPGDEVYVRVRINDSDDPYFRFETSTDIFEIESVPFSQLDPEVIADKVKAALSAYIAEASNEQNV